MKKSVFLLLGISLIAAFGLASCKNQKSGKVLTVGATLEPHAELLNYIKSDFEKKGYELKVVEFNDYLTPNSALISGDLDANFFQHIQYLESNADWNKVLASAFGVHIEPLGLYSRKYKDLSEIPNGATIAIPNDPSNGGRALLLLQSAGLITLDKKAGFTATALDIVDNPKNIKIVPIEAAQLPRTLDDVDVSAINGNFALEAHLKPAKDAFFLEGSDSPYVNIVTVKKGDENDPRIIALKEVLLSDKVRKYIADRWQDGSVIAIF
jgi:D-methionine transport system substrate-binding protein